MIQLRCTKRKSLSLLCIILILLLILTGCANTKEPSKTKITAEKIDSIPKFGWQCQGDFPDRRGFIDDTLAMNSLMSFDGYADQGEMYLFVQDGVESFDLFINNAQVDTGKIEAGNYKIDFSKAAINGRNTVQVTNITPADIENGVSVFVAYPTVIDGTLEEVGIDIEPLRMIEGIIESDINNGFTGAQLVIVKDGKLVYQNAWGQLNSYNPDGSIIEDGTPVGNETMYDLASNTKMYATAYAIQYLVDKGELSLTEKVVDIIGKEFVDNTLEIQFATVDGGYPGLDTIKEWKSKMTVKNVMMHQAGFPDSGHYHNQKFDTPNQCLSDDVDNVLYVADANKEKTLKEGICKTPLMFEPGTIRQYSDIDYMLLGLIVEKVTGKPLDDFLNQIFWEPMGLTRITYAPLENGYSKDDCAATELNGNTRDGLIEFPRVRTETVQGEVHDEECYYTMEGVSGHAGLFASATDLAKLASVMLTGGYGENRFFSRDTLDLFIAPQDGAGFNYGIGWWREGESRREWYFGTQSSSNTVGHQGWTGTLTMIDFENDMVVVYLTNSINTPIVDPTSLDNANSFAGKYYTSATLGFVPQLLYTGMTGEGDVKAALNSLLTDMINEKQKLVEELEETMGGEVPEDHPIMKALKALQEVEAL